MARRNLATVDFVGDVQNACERQRALGTIANTIILSYPLWNFIRRAPLFQNYVRGNFPTVLPTIITPEQVASVFQDQGIEQFLIGGAYQDIGGEGQLYLGQPIWPNSQFFVGKISGGDFLAGGAMRTIAWSGRRRLQGRRSLPRRRQAIGHAAGPAIGHRAGHRSARRATHQHRSDLRIGAYLTFRPRSIGETSLRPAELGPRGACF